MFKTVKTGMVILAAVLAVTGSASAKDDTTFYKQAAPYYTALTPGSAVFGPGGTGFPVGKLSTVINYRFIKTDGVRLDNDKINNNTKMTKNVGIFKLRYGIAPGLDIRTGTTFYDLDKKTTSGDNHIVGRGDTVVELHKVLWNQQKGHPFYFAIDFGGIVPTSTHSRHNSYFIGNNAWGGVVGCDLTYLAGSNRFDQEVNFATFSKGDYGYRKPNRLRINTAWAYAFNSTYDAGIESNFEINGDSETDDVSTDNSKVEWYMGPKVAFKCHKYKFNTILALMLPVYRHYDSATPSDGFRVELKLIKVWF